MTVLELQHELEFLGFSRGKITRHVRQSIIAIAVNGWISDKDVALLSSLLQPVGALNFRTLSWWECRLEKWVIKWK